MESLPIGARIRPGYGLSIIETRIPPRHKITVEVGNCPIRVGIHRVIRRITLYLKHLKEPLEIGLLGPFKRLNQRRHRIPIHCGRDPMPVSLCGNWAMVRAVEGDRDFFQLALLFDPKGFLKRPNRPLLKTVAIPQSSVGSRNLLSKVIHKIKTG